MTATPDTEKQPIMPERNPRKHPEREAFLRSADSPEEDGRFHRVFAVAVEAYGTDGDDDLHRRNSLAVLEQAVQQGLRPVGEATFDGVGEPRPGDFAGDLVRLRYSVDVTPASARKAKK